MDTSILVRLLTGDPPELFERCVGELSRLADSHQVFASNQVIGESYVAVQHHYGVTKPEARSGLGTVLRSGLVAPLGGPPVMDALRVSGGCGLLDRLIALDYRQAELTTLTLDERMAKLDSARLLLDG